MVTHQNNYTAWITMILEFDLFLIILDLLTFKKVFKCIIIFLKKTEYVLLCECCKICKHDSRWNLKSYEILLINSGIKLCRGKSKESVS